MTSCMATLPQTDLAYRHRIHTTPDDNKANFIHTKINQRDKKC
jgi:hypothetical protein